MLTMLCVVALVVLAVLVFFLEDFIWENFVPDLITTGNGNAAWLFWIKEILRKAVYLGAGVLLHFVYIHNNHNLRYAGAAFVMFCVSGFVILAVMVLVYAGFQWLEDYLYDWKERRSKAPGDGG